MLQSISILLRTIATAYRSTVMFGQASGPIFLENLRCSGDESAIFDCPQSVLGLHQCDHSQDAGVQCNGTYLCIYIVAMRQIFGWAGGLGTCTCPNIN